ncbi:MAG TPA: helix-turn-helix domain-containing protein [bacterium]|nr:helix-turn-helix domain-containing protein [bacterium]HMW32266.1 helix-turn-helix domain-containing protein [bacterium]HMW36958.1 helix-turn-helix domain-containing protein [bacterium]HMZ03380.1 helix-turn-helix domain-containing protein [bacterium]HNB07982.1 helix-turn-helix domain-containing protein [bacterium]
MIWTIIYTLIFGQGIFLAIVLFFNKKGSVLANKSLALLMLIFSSAVLEQLIRISGLFSALPHMLFISVPFWYALAPAYYLYAKNLVEKQNQFVIKDAWHALPFLGVILLLSPYYLWDVQKKIAYIIDPSQFNDFALESIILNVVMVLQNVMYLTMAIRLLSQNEAYSKLNRIIRFLFSIMMGYVVFNFINAIYFLFTGETLVHWGNWSIPIFATIIYTIAFLSFVSPETIFFTLWPRNNNSLSKERKHEVLNQLYKLMEQDKIYREPDLRYTEVAARLGISARCLSALLSEDIGMTFNVFVNTYRVKDAQNQLRERYCEETLLAIALDSGFSGKSSFNRIFKEQTGLTPSEFVYQSN